MVINIIIRLSLDSYFYNLNRPFKLAIIITRNKDIIFYNNLLIFLFLVPLKNKI